MFYDTISAFFEAEGDFEENLECGFCDGPHHPNDCAQMQQTVREYGDA